MLNRLGRIVTVSIAGLALLIVIAVYWYAIRPLPKMSGEIMAPIAGSAIVKRDARGIPHIEAASCDDAIFLQGYVTAQDRLWQMDALRRYSAGELAEVFGEGLLPLDERSRRMRMRASAVSHALRLRAGERAAFDEYARGVNFFIDTHRGDYSLEFSIPGRAYDPWRWTVVDSILVGLAMFRNLTDSSKFEFAKGELMAEADPAKARFLFPSIAGTFLSPGSNAWAVSGAHVADGKPILANDPHLAYAIPDTWHLVHLKAPGLDVSGAALPGVPGVITGHNEQIAWGVTNLEADVMDFYKERLDENTGRYLFRGTMEQAQLDRERIAVRGSRPIEVNIWVTRHGPVLRTEGGTVYSMRWTAADGFGFPFLDIDCAQNWQQFRNALSTYWGPGQNFVYADRAGNIGYQAAGRVPIRRGFDGDVPLDGTSGAYEWDGYIPFEQMPHVYTLSSDILATANQNPFPPDFPYRVDGNFADLYRVEEIRALLNRKPKLTIGDMLAIQKDVYSAYDYFLAQQALAALRTRPTEKPIVREAAELLERWNGQMEKDQAAPLITELFSRELGEELIRVSLNRDFRATLPDIRPRPQVIETLLRKRPQGWVAHDNWDEWLTEAFGAALENGRREQGSAISRWRWGKMLRWHLEHPVGRQLLMFDRLFNIGPVEMSGSGTSVKQTTVVVGPSERMVVDLGDLDSSVQNLVAGESGFVASAHYKDQWNAYYSGKSFPMEFWHVDAKEVLRVRPSK